MLINTGVDLKWSGVSVWTVSGGVHDPGSGEGAEAKPEAVELDLSDVKRRVGQEVGGWELIEPCSATDIRRWVMAMDFPNPIHWDDEFAKASKFGGIVAPQSFAVGMDSAMARSRLAWVTFRART